MDRLKMNIIIADDMTEIRKILINCLRSMGFYNITECSDGVDVLQALEELKKINKQAHLIISDINMPYMDGLELLSTIRSMKYHKRIPFILVTTDNNTETILAAIENKVSDYIIKPFDNESIKTKISGVLARFN